MKTIETDRLILRKVQNEDADDIFKILSDPDVITNLNMNIHKNIDDTTRLLQEYFEGLKEGTKFPYAMIDKNTNEFLGVFLIKLDLYDEDCFELTVYIGKEHWGKGIYKEALPHIVKVAFEEIKTGNVRGFVKEKNIISAKVLEKNGFTLEKVFEVPGIEGKIKSYLITKQEYERKSE